MVIRMRHTRSKTGQRRSHHSLSVRGTGTCSHCSKVIVRHKVCPNCGYYKGRQVTDVHAKIDSKNKKKELKDKKAEKEENQKEPEAKE